MYYPIRIKQLRAELKKTNERGKHHVLVDIYLMCPPHSPDIFHCKKFLLHSLTEILLEHVWTCYLFWGCPGSGRDWEEVEILIWDCAQVEILVWYWVQMEILFWDWDQVEILIWDWAQVEILVWYWVQMEILIWDWAQVDSLVRDWSEVDILVRDCSQVDTLDRD